MEGAGGGVVKLKKTNKSVENMIKERWLDGLNE